MSNFGPNDLVFEDLEFRGIMSFGNEPHKISLNNRTITAIVGVNHDSTGENERNGCGKSSIIDAVFYAWFGSPYREIPNKTLKNYRLPDRVPMLVISHATRNGFRYRVERGESPSRLKFYKRPIDETGPWTVKDEDGNPKFDKTLRKSTETNEEIVRSIGLSEEIAAIIMVMSPARNPVFMMREDERRDLIERLFSFTIMSERAKVLKQQRQDETKRLVSLRSGAEATKQANERIQNEIKLLRAQSVQWEAERQRDLSAYRKFVTQHQDTNFDEQIEILQTKLDLGAELVQINHRLNQAKKNLESATSSYNQFEANRKATITRLQVEIDGYQSADPEADLLILQETAASELALSEKSMEVQKSKVDMLNATHARDSLTSELKQLLQKKKALEDEIAEFKEGVCPTCGGEWNDTDHTAHNDGKKDELVLVEDGITALNVKIENSDHDRIITTHQELVKAFQAATDAHTRREKPKFFKTTEDVYKVKEKVAELSMNLLNTEKTKNPHEETIAHHEINVTAHTAELEDAQSLLAEINAVKTVFSSVTLARESQAYMDSAVSSLQVLEKAVDPHNSTIESLEQNALKTIDYTEIEKLEADIELYTMLIELLTDKDSFIRKGILAKWTPRLNRSIEGYLRQFQLPYKVEFDTNTAVRIAPRGVKDVEVGYKQISRGEQTRIWLATYWAFLDIFAEMNFKINLFMIDELFDNGMSEFGAGVGYRIIEDWSLRNDKTVYLITHRNDIVDICPNTMTVELRNGISTIA